MREMAYRIIVEFPDKETADAFCSQMEDGFGENVCDFSRWRQKPNTNGTSADDFEQVLDEHGTQVCFIASLRDEAGQQKGSET